ncbi:MAG: carboxyl transferase domain-containing protein, partial [Mycobacteriales bacterium]
RTVTLLLVRKTSQVADWRTTVLDGIDWVPGGPRDGLRRGRTSWQGHEVVVAAWDFAVYGGSFGVAASTAFAAACDDAVDRRLPLVSLVRSGGTRLQEGIAALAGMPRAVLALDRLAAAGLPHLAVCDQPTTGGVWVTVASRADVRIAVAGAVVGFAGPRVVEALTGARPEGSHTARSAYDAGLVDVLVDAADVAATVAGALEQLLPGPPAPQAVPKRAQALDREPWKQVLATRASGLAAGAWLRAQLGDGAVPLRAADPTCAAWLGRWGGRPVVAYALGVSPGDAPGVAGFGLLERACGLAGRLGLPLVTAVDTPGADARSASENAGLAPAIGAAMAALLRCPTPTVGVLVGEGGSGGALAALATDRLWVTPDSYFAALVPEGAAAALKCSPEEAAVTLRLRPADVAALPVCDGILDPDDAAGTIAAALDEVGRDGDRLAHRRARWG